LLIGGETTDAELLGRSGSLLGRPPPPPSAGPDYSVDTEEGGGAQRVSCLSAGGREAANERGSSLLVRGGWTPPELELSFGSEIGAGGGKSWWGFSESTNCCGGGPRPTGGFGPYGSSGFSVGSPRGETARTSTGGELLN
jgi:hypothetical protein